MDIMTGLATASQAIKLANELRGIDKAMDAAEFKLKIADLTIALSDIKLALSEAKETISTKDAEITSLKAQFKRNAELVGYDYHSDPRVSNTWKFRFDFFEKYGLPRFWEQQTRQFVEGVRALAYVDGMIVRFNLYAYIFGPIYLIILGLGRKAISALPLYVGVGFIYIWALTADNGHSMAGHAIVMGCWVCMAGLMAYIGINTNAWYYLYKVKGQNTFSLRSSDGLVGLPM
jgi:hypothetical protein